MKKTIVELESENQQLLEFIGELDYLRNRDIELRETELQRVHEDCKKAETARYDALYSKYETLLSEMEDMERRYDVRYELLLKRHLEKFRGVVHESKLNVLTANKSQDRIKNIADSKANALRVIRQLRDQNRELRNRSIKAESENTELRRIIKQIKNGQLQISGLSVTIV